MKKSAFISDVIFNFFTGTLFTLCVFRYLGAGFTLALVLSLPCGTLLAAAFAAYRQSKRKTIFLKRSDTAQKEKLLLHLALLSDEAKTSFFQDVFSTHSPSERKSEATLPVKRLGKLRLYTTNEFFFLHFKIHPVTADEVVALSRLKTNKPRTLFCAQIEDPAYALCEQLGIQVKTGEAVYCFLKACDALPEKYLGEESSTNKRKRRLQLWFAKGNSKRFLVAGGLVLLTSLFSPFPYYYLVFSGVLLLASILVRVLGYE